MLISSILYCDGDGISACIDKVRYIRTRLIGFIDILPLARTALIIFPCPGNGGIPRHIHQMNGLLGLSGVSAWDRLLLKIIHAGLNNPIIMGDHHLTWGVCIKIILTPGGFTLIHFIFLRIICKGHSHGAFPLASQNRGGRAAFAAACFPIYRLSGFHIFRQAGRDDLNRLSLIGTGNNEILGIVEYHTGKVQFSLGDLHLNGEFLFPKSSYRR